MAVLVKLKVMPKSREIDIEELKKKIDVLIRPVKIEVEDIAFGLRALIVSSVIEDKKGSLEEIENKIKSLEDVKSVETVYITRTL